MPWGVIFPRGGALPRHPSQLYEALLEGALLFLIITAAYKLGARKRPGLMIGLFLIGYGLSRIFVELFRQPDEQVGFLFNAITMGQLLSLPMVIIGIWLVGRAARIPQETSA